MIDSLLAEEAAKDAADEAMDAAAADATKE